ncbi:MAG: hypothetical protein PHW63_01680 [Alphaproteobacteria bacterium]|nr:hypothetical protein [Alphaproteobacteria bacterium]
MTEDYVNAKIHEALKATGGNKRDAGKLLVTWAVRDLPLLLGLTKSSLKGIVDDAIADLMKTDKKAGHSFDDAIVFPTAKGEKRRPSKVPPPKSSERQATVMHQLAAAFKKKK